MGCFADDMVMWKDFPKGLRVLLVGDSTSTAETKSRLEAMDYIGTQRSATWLLKMIAVLVSLYCDEKDALEAITSKTDNFHVAILEVTTDNTYGSFRFLEMAKDLPTIVTSSVPCISTTVKCIALGAAEFLQKPLSEDKLRNIWQHLVHKAFNAGGDVLSKSLEPIKETLVSMLQRQSDKDETKIEFTFKSEIKQEDREKVHLNTDESDNLLARSTPQLVKGGRFMEDGDFHARTIFSIEKENIENSKDLSVVKKCTRSETKSVHNTCNNLNSADRNNKEVLNANPKKAAVEEEVDSTDGSRTEESIVVKGSQASDVHDMDNVKSVTDGLKKGKSSHDTTSCSHRNRGSRKKIKVDWTSELHKQFVRAVEQLGVDQAIPSKILELMKVEGLTRHNIASHLQKYRMHRRHILPKESDRRWQPPMLRGFMPRPPMVFPPFQSNYGLPPTQVYPVWGHPSYHHPAVPMWGYPGLSTSTWHQPQGSWLCNTHPGIRASEWGFPIVPSYSQSSIPTRSTTMGNSLDAMGGRSRDMKDFSEFYLKDEVIDEVVKEAMSKPWLPLPLGLKPPSTDSVLTELHRQGICTIPLHR